MSWWLHINWNKSHGMCSVVHIKRRKSFYSITAVASLEIKARGTSSYRIVRALLPLSSPSFWRILLLPSKRPTNSVKRVCMSALNFPLYIQFLPEVLYVPTTVIASCRGRYSADYRGPALFFQKNGNSCERISGCVKVREKYTWKKKNRKQVRQCAIVLKLSWNAPERRSGTFLTAGAALRYFSAGCRWSAARSQDFPENQLTKMLAKMRPDRLKMH